MRNPENMPIFNASPEGNFAGREAFHAFSSGSKPEKDPREEFDLEEIVERGRKRLIDEIEKDEQRASEGEQNFSSSTRGVDTRRKKEKTESSSWEPFNSEPHDSQRFINLYGGPYFAQMELHRENAERLLDVGAIEGKVVIADMPRDRSRNIEGLNPDGSATKRRGLFWGEKLEDDDQSQTLVKPIPEGWRIEIPGEDILDELSRKDSKKPLDERFSEKFNQILRDSLREVMFREKLTSDSGVFYNLRTSFTAIELGIFITLGIGAYNGNISNESIGIIAGTQLSFNVGFNEVLRNVGWSRKSLIEKLLPPIEFDRYARGIAFMKNKGRNLVRLRPEG
ncbi:MAG: hypothetical protein AAB521_00610 [Patescibacteria group bacterium]